MEGITLHDLKKFLIDHGYIVYRTSEQSVHLAERVRENLIMDANVSVCSGPTLRVRFTTRAQRSDFPSSHETPAMMFERARRVAAGALSKGFRESGAEVAPQLDPVEPAQVLDVWYEVVFEKELMGPDNLQETLEYVLQVEKVAPR